MDAKNLVGGNDKHSRRDFVKLAAVVGAGTLAGLCVKPALGEDIKESDFEDIMNSEPPHTIRDSSGYEYTINKPIGDVRIIGGTGSDTTILIPGPRSDPNLETGFSRGYTDPDTGILRLNIDIHEYPNEERYNLYKGKFINVNIGDEYYFGNGGSIVSMDHMGASQVSNDNYLFILEDKHIFRESSYHDSEFVMFDDQKKTIIRITTDLECDIYGSRKSTPEDTVDLISDYVTNTYKEIAESFTYWDGTESKKEFEPIVGHYTYQPDFNTQAKPVDLEFLWPTSFDWLVNHPEESRKMGIALSAAAYKYESESVLSSLEMQDIESWDKDNCKHFTGDSSLSFTLSHKALEDGKELICVVGRGTAGSSEWNDNILHGVNSTFLENDHVGFRLAAVGVRGQIQEYIDTLVNQGIKQDNMCFYFTGHSRAGAVMNLIAESYIKLYPKGVIADTYATPNTSQSKATLTSRIRNYVNSDDIVHMVPFNGKKAGITYGYTSSPDQVKAFYDVKKLTSFNIVNNHMPEDLVAKIYGKNSPNSEWDNSGWIEFGLHCPVDIEVYDDITGELVASVNESTEHDDADYNLSAGVLATEFNDEKLIYLPADRTYTAKTAAYSNGTMTCRVKQSNGSKEPIVLVEQIDIPVTQNVDRSVVVGEEFTPLDEYKITPIGNIVGGAVGVLATGAVAVSIIARRNKNRKAKDDSQS